MQEFSSISVSSFEAGTLADQLTEKSREGWEVAAIIPTGTTVTAYLRRAADESAVVGESATASDRATASESATASDSATADDAGLPGTEGGVVDEQLVVASVSDELGAADTAEQIEDDLAAGTADEPTVGDDLGSADGGSPEAALDEVAPDTAAAQVDEPAAAAEPAQGGDDDIAALAAAAAAEAETPNDRPEDEPGGWAATGTATDTTSEPAPDDSAGATAAATQEAAPESSEATTAAAGAASDTSTAATSTGAAPAGWYADPSGRFELRYWDGSQWTEHVSRAGQQFTDPPVA